MHLRRVSAVSGFEMGGRGKHISLRASLSRKRVAKRGDSQHEQEAKEEEEGEGAEATEGEVQNGGRSRVRMRKRRESRAESGEKQSPPPPLSSPSLQHFLPRPPCPAPPCNYRLTTATHTRGGREEEEEEEGAGRRILSPGCNKPGREKKSRNKAL